MVDIVRECEELAEPENLENLVDLRLYLYQRDVPAFRFQYLQEGDEGADAGAGNIGESTTVKDEPVISAFDKLVYAPLKLVGIIGVDIALEVKDDPAFDPLELRGIDPEAIDGLIVEVGNGLATHGFPVS